MVRQKKTTTVTEDEMLVYGKYLQVATILRHSNRIQLRYKLTTFTWFLATFIGVGYSLSNLEVNLPFHPFLIAALLCFASLLVIGVIWYLDIIVHEKNIAIAVHQGLNLETEHPWLPQTYHNVVRLNYLLRYVSMKSVFYLGFSTILLLNIGFCICSYLYLHGFKSWPWILILILAAIPILFFISNMMTKITDPYVTMRKLQRKKKYGNG